MTSETIVANALLDLNRVSDLSGVTWTLIGGEALISYGVPRETLDADALIVSESLEEVADVLVTMFGWSALEYSEESGGYVEVDKIVTHFMDDPVLFDIGQERRMVPLRSPLGLPVELLAAQHPIEQEMMELAVYRIHHGVRVPVAPLGGILMVKTKANRVKDIAAIEQTSEHLSSSQIKEAIIWAEDRDIATAEDMKAILTAARVRRIPKRTQPYIRKR